MKKLTKWITLMLAGLLLSTTLFACDDGYDWAEDDSDDGNDDKEKQSESFDKYKSLSPDEVWDALLESKDFTISMHVVATDGEMAQEVIYNFGKDNKKVKLQSTVIARNGEKTEETAYCDLDKAISYTQDSNGKWIAENSEEDDIDLADILDDMLPTDLLFGEDCYDKYDSKTRSYPMIEEKMVEEIGGDETMTASGSMTRKGTEYTFALTAEQDGTTQTVNVVIEFKSVSVELPNVDLPEGGNQGESAVDTTAPENENNPAVTDKIPAVTDKKPEDQVPDVPVMNERSTPSEVYEFLKAEHSCRLIVGTYTDDGSIDTELNIYKEGDYLYLTIESGSYTSSSYMDLSAGLLYTKEVTDDDSQWVYEESTSVISWPILVESFFAENLSFCIDDSNYGLYSYDEMRYTVKASVLSALSNRLDTEILSAYMENLGTGHYIYKISEYSADEDVNISNYINVMMDDYYVTLPSYAMDKEEYEESLKEKEEEDEKEEDDFFDSTPYENLNPGELYKAMLTSPELYLFLEVDGNQIKMERSGDIVCLDFYDASTETIETYYQDLSTQSFYQWRGGSQYELQEDSYTWEELLTDIVGISEDTYFLRDDCYKPFDDSTMELELDPDRFTVSIRNAAMQRSGAYYHFEGKIDSQSVYVTIQFSDRDVELPF